MIDIARGGWTQTSGKPTLPIAGSHVIGQRFRNAVGAASVVEQVADDRVGNEPTKLDIVGELSEKIARRARADWTLADQLGRIV